MLCEILYKYIHLETHYSRTCRRRTAGASANKTIIKVKIIRNLQYKTIGQIELGKHSLQWTVRTQQYRYNNKTTDQICAKSPLWNV